MDPVLAMVKVGIVAAKRWHLQLEGKDRPTGEEKGKLEVLMVLLSHHSREVNTSQPPSCSHNLWDAIFSYSKVVGI